MILFYTDSQDSGCDFLINLLKSRNIDYIRLNSDYLPSYHLTFTIEQGLHSIMVGDQIIYPSTLSGVYFRVPYKLDRTILNKIDKQFRDFINVENEALGIGVLLSLEDNLRWLNHPRTSIAASYKIYQLAKAIDVGFKVPDTLIAHNETDLLDFWKRSNQLQNEVITKAIHRGYIESEEEDQSLLLFTSQVLEENLNDLENSQYIPTLFQNRLSDGLNIRVMIIGSEYFAVQVVSNQLDWRRIDVQVPDYEVISLPPDIISKCAHLLKQLGLSYGAIDLFLTYDEDCYFFEINPSGTWLEIQKKTNMPIAEAIIEFLLS